MFQFDPECWFEIIYYEIKKNWFNPDIKFLKPGDYINWIESPYGPSHAIYRVTKYEGGYIWIEKYGNKLTEFGTDKGCIRVNPKDIHKYKIAI